MALLCIDLQDGFMGDTVVILINGKDVFRRADVKTKPQIGWTYISEKINVQEGQVNVEITLPLRNLSESIVLQVSTPAYLGISVTEANRISFRISHEPFGYL